MVQTEEQTGSMAAGHRDDFGWMGSRTSKSEGQGMSDVLGGEWRLRWFGCAVDGRCRGKLRVELQEEKTKEEFYECTDAVMSTEGNS